jgi:hypothetical protein
MLKGTKASAMARYCLEQGTAGRYVHYFNSWEIDFLTDISNWNDRFDKEHLSEKQERQMLRLLNKLISADDFDVAYYQLKDITTAAVNKEIDDFLRDMVRDGFAVSEQDGRWIRQLRERPLWDESASRKIGWTKLVRG